MLVTFAMTLTFLYKCVLTHNCCSKHLQNCTHTSLVYGHSLYTTKSYMACMISVCGYVMFPTIPPKETPSIGS